MLLSKLDSQIAWRNHIFAGGVIGCGLVLSIVAQLVAARLLGAEEFGRFSYITGLATAIGLSVKLGYDFAGTKFLAIAREPRQFAAIFRFIMRQTWLLALLSLILFVAAALIEADSTSALVACSSAIALMSGPVVVLKSALIARNQVAKASLHDTYVRNFVFVALLGGLIAWRAQLGAVAAAAAFSAGTAVATLLLDHATRKLVAGSPAEPVPEPIRKEIRAYAWSLGGTSLITAMWARADIVLAAWLIDDWRVVGAYAVAVRLRALVSSIETILDPLFAPKIARRFAEHGWSELSSLRLAYTLVGTSWATGTLLVFLVVGGFVLGHLGPDYAAARPFLLILLGAQAAKTLFGPIHLMMTMTHMEKETLYSSGLAFVTFVVLSIVLARMFGIWGLVWAAAVGIVARALFQQVFVWIFGGRSG